MPRADDTGAASFRIERYAHCRHERTRSENAAEIVVHRLHDRDRLVMLEAAIMEKELRQRGEKCGRRSGPGGVGNPKKGSFVSHPQPAINGAAHLDDRT